jgi:hypothetical protein
VIQARDVRHPRDAEGHLERADARDRCGGIEQAGGTADVLLDRGPPARRPYRSVGLMLVGATLVFTAGRVAGPLNVCQLKLPPFTLAALAERADRSLDFFFRPPDFRLAFFPIA